ncbi:MAG: hypothetical protein Q7R83_00665 [bacterium]|nr:hypothetical protein [bacterium]
MMKNNRLFNKNLLARTISALLLVVVVFPMTASAAQAWSIKDFVPLKLRLALTDTKSADEASFVVPQKAKEVEAAKTIDSKQKAEYTVDATAYTSSVEECDADPFITADGSTTRDGIIAANFLPFGTKVRIPSVYGDRVFEVHDRMNKRYRYRVDVWMSNKADMWNFGIHKNIKIEIVEWGTGETQWKRIAAENMAKKKAAAEKLAAEKKQVAVEQK